MDLLYKHIKGHPGWYNRKWFQSEIMSRADIRKWIDDELQRALVTIAWEGDEEEWMPVLPLQEKANLLGSESRAKKFLEGVQRLGTLEAWNPWRPWRVL